MSVRKSCYTCRYYHGGDCLREVNCPTEEVEYWELNPSAKVDAILDGEPVSEHDSVNHPSHYCQGGIECIDALKAATVNLKGIKAVCTANAIKYLWRHESKNGIEDLKKAIWYIERLIEELEEENKNQERDFA